MMSIALLLAASTGAWLYAPVLGGLVRQWLDDPVASYGALLICVAGFVAWRRRRDLRAAVRHPTALGFAVLAAGMLVYLLGTLMGEVFIQRASLPITIGGTILAIGGAGHLALLAPALLLLALAIPLPSVLVTRLTLPLQLVASGIAADVLTAGRIHVIQQGNLLVLDNITLEVAEACSGLRSVLSLFSVAAVCAAVFPIGRRRSALIVAAVVPVAIVGNGLRVAATGALASRFGQVAVEGVVHELTGFVAFAAMCGAVLAILPLTRPVRAVSAPARTAGLQAGLDRQRPIAATARATSADANAVRPGTPENREATA
jgi:exosortase